MSVIRTIFGAGLLLLSTPGHAAGPADDPEPFDPAGSYEVRAIEGWTVLVNRRLLRDPDLSERTLKLLGRQLDQVARRLPAKAVARLREVKIWVEEDEPHHPCMAYHPDAGWLRDHAMNPEKARCVEVADARAFLDWTGAQPWMVLHELAHAYHDRFLADGFRNAAVREAHDHAQRAGTYESVPHVDGRERRAYALNDPMEYFAEGTEAFFGTNDFYPFVRPELERHDRDLYNLLESLWDPPEG